MSKFPKRKRGRVIASILVIVAGASVAVVVWRDQPTATVAQAASIFKSATVTSGDMTTTERIDGTVELSSTLTVLHRIEGQTSTSSTAAARSPNPGGGTETAAEVTQTITSIIAVNAQPHNGDVVYSVDGSPVIALDGALPAWRSMSTSSDDGADIAQLESSLVALGYDPDAKVTVDNEFDAATRAMVKRWQEGLGVEATGEVELGSFVFLPSATTVTAVERAVGDSVSEGDAVLQLAASTQDVVIEVPEDDQSLVVPGLAVMVGDLQGTVSELRSADSDGSVVVEAVVIPASEIEGATNGSTVKVTLTLESAQNVLLVPAEALVSRIDGTYAVQLETADETTKWLTVEFIGATGSNVAIRADGLAEGTGVLLPV